MKKLFWLYAMILVLGFYNVASAEDSCLILDRTGSWMNDLTQGQVNQAISAGKFTQEEYDRRTLPFDFVSVVDTSRCPETSTTGAKFVTIVIVGLSLVDAQQYIDSWVEMTGELDSDGNPIYAVKNTHKYGLKNVPQNVMNIIGVQDWIEINWVDICAYINNKMTDLTGAGCP